MANLDTGTKRRAAIGRGFLWMRLGPVPDGSVSSALDRRQISALYRYTAPSPPTLYSDSVATAAYGLSVGAEHGVQVTAAHSTILSSS